MSYRLEIGLALLLATAIGVALWAATRAPKPPESDARASTFLTGPQGSKALYDVLIRLKRPTERRRTSLFDFAHAGPRTPAILVVLDPPLPLQDAEIDEVVEFVLEGGAVVAAGHGGGITRCAGWRLRPEYARDDSVAVRLREGQGPLRLPYAARVLVRGARRYAEERPLRDLVKGERDAEALCADLNVARVDTIVMARDGRPVIVQVRYDGGGSIALAADTRWFTNEMWRDTDVPLVVLPLLTTRADSAGQGRGRGRGRVSWDEYHQGFGDQGEASLTGRTWSWLLRAPAGWAILQLIAVALVWLAVTAVRFGPARAVIERRRRSPIEHLEALAAGLESAAANETAVERIIAGLRRRLARTGQLAAGNIGPWLESLELAMRGTRGRAAVRRLRHLITERDGDDTSGARVLAAAQAVEDVWEELRPRSTRDAY